MDENGNLAIAARGRGYSDEVFYSYSNLAKTDQSLNDAYEEERLDRKSVV